MNLRDLWNHRQNLREYLEQQRAEANIVHSEEKKALLEDQGEKSPMLKTLHDKAASSLVGGVSYFVLYKHYRR